jgi:hypothetical protein
MEHSPPQDIGWVKTQCNVHLGYTRVYRCTDVNVYQKSTDDATTVM